MSLPLSLLESAPRARRSPHFAEPLVPADLRRALVQSQFVLHYQPKLDLRLGRLCGGEALLRWSHPRLGLLAPHRFVPLLEESGLIIEVGAWALRQAMVDRARWQSQNLAPPPIAVNVSPMQLAAPGFVDSVVEALDVTCGLEIEVTESRPLPDEASSARALASVRALGVSVALDDFGTGHSSAARLAALPIDALKIGQDTVGPVARSEAAAEAVRDIVALARARRLTVVAEGVETTLQLAVLRRLGCDQMQGFLFSKPVPASEFAGLLRSGRSLAA